MHEGDSDGATASLGRPGLVGGLGPDARARFYRFLSAGVSPGILRAQLRRRALQRSVRASADATCERVRRREARRMGLLATAMTTRSGVYKRSLEPAVSGAATPGRHAQQHMGEIIDRLLLVRHTDEDQRSLAGVASLPGLGRRR